MGKKRGGLGKKGGGLGKKCILEGKKLNSLGNFFCIIAEMRWNRQRHKQECRNIRVPLLLETKVLVPSQSFV